MLNLNELKITAAIRSHETIKKIFEKKLANTIERLAEANFFDALLQANKLAVDKEQDYNKETTTFFFDDDSKIIFYGESQATKVL